MTNNLNTNFIDPWIPESFYVRAYSRYVDEKRRAYGSFMEMCQMCVSHPVPDVDEKDDFDLDAVIAAQTEFNPDTLIPLKEGYVNLRSFLADLRATVINACDSEGAEDLFSLPCSGQLHTATGQLISGTVPSWGEVLDAVDQDLHAVTSLSSALKAISGSNFADRMTIYTQSMAQSYKDVYAKSSQASTAIEDLLRVASTPATLLKSFFNAFSLDRVETEPISVISSTPFAQYTGASPVGALFLNFDVVSFTNSVHEAQRAAGSVLKRMWSGVKNAINRVTTKVLTTTVIPNAVSEGASRDEDNSVNGFYIGRNLQRVSPQLLYALNCPQDVIDSLSETAEDFSSESVWMISTVFGSVGFSSASFTTNYGADGYDIPQAAGDFFWKPNSVDPAFCKAWLEEIGQLSGADTTFTASNMLAWESSHPEYVAAMQDNELWNFTDFATDATSNRNAFMGLRMASICLFCLLRYFNCALIQQMYGANLSVGLLARNPLSTNSVALGALKFNADLSLSDLANPSNADWVATASGFKPEGSGAISATNVTRDSTGLYGQYTDDTVGSLVMLSGGPRLNWSTGSTPTATIWPQHQVNEGFDLAPMLYGEVLLMYLLHIRNRHDYNIDWAFIPYVNDDIAPGPGRYTVKTDSEVKFAYYAMVTIGAAIFVAAAVYTAVSILGVKVRRNRILKRQRLTATANAKAARGEPLSKKEKKNILRASKQSAVASSVGSNFRSTSSDVAADVNVSDTGNEAAISLSAIHNIIVGPQDSDEF